MFFCMSAIQLGLKFVSKIVTLFEYSLGMNVRVKALSKRTNGIWYAAQWSSSICRIVHRDQCKKSSVDDGRICLSLTYVKLMYCSKF